jgi:hypothetical protein
MYEFLASLTLIIHFLFIIFVIFGGLLFFINAWTLYFHIPAFLYGATSIYLWGFCGVYSKHLSAHLLRKLFFAESAKSNVFRHFYPKLSAPNYLPCLSYFRNTNQSWFDVSYT